MPAGRHPLSPNDCTLNVDSPSACIMPWKFAFSMALPYCHPIFWLGNQASTVSSRCRNTCGGGRHALVLSCDTSHWRMSSPRNCLFAPWPCPVVIQRKLSLAKPWPSAVSTHTPLFVLCVDASYSGSPPATHQSRSFTHFRLFALRVAAGSLSKLYNFFSVSSGIRRPCHLRSSACASDHCSCESVLGHGSP